MICPKCGANMTLRKGTCSKCGYDMEVDEKTRKISCYFYNQGLDKAKIRDLSGAVEMLNRALKIYKRNIDARNLLGLVYFEMGETVAAIHEWILSRSYQEQNNIAEHYLTELQSSPTKLDGLNMAIKKYNDGLKLAAEHGDDLALINLKKAVAQNPRFIRAWQLLALVYMRQGEYDRARRCLKRTLSIDIANTTSIRYLKEIRNLKGNGIERSGLPETGAEIDPNSKEMTGKAKTGILPRFSYKDDAPDYRAFICLVVGLFLGILTVYLMVVPGVRTGMREEFKATQAEYGEELSEYLSDIDALEKENQALQSKLELQDLDLEGYKDEVKELTDKVGGLNMFRMLSYYMKLQKQEGSASKVQLYLLQQRLLAVSEEELAKQEAKDLYDQVAADYPDALTVTMTSTELYDEGVKLFEKEKYEDALEFFQYSYEKSADNEKNLYLLARTNHLLKNKEAAIRYYNEYTERFPDGSHKDDVKKYLNAIK